MIISIDPCAGLEGVFNTIMQQLASENIDMLNNDMTIIISTTGGIIQDSDSEDAFPEAEGAVYINESIPTICEYWWGESDI